MLRHFGNRKFKILKFYNLNVLKKERVFEVITKNILTSLKSALF